MWRLRVCICRLYKSSNFKSVNKARYFLFAKKQQSSDNLPPTLESSKQHCMRANCQSCMVTCDISISESSSSNKTWLGTVFRRHTTRYYDTDPAHKELTALTVCHCKSDLSCSDACGCDINLCKTESYLIEEDQSDDETNDVSDNEA